MPLGTPPAHDRIGLFLGAVVSPKAPSRECGAAKGGTNLPFSSMNHDTTSPAPGKSGPIATGITHDNRCPRCNTQGARRFASGRVECDQCGGVPDGPRREGEPDLHAVCVHCGREYGEHSMGFTLIYPLHACPTGPKVDDFHPTQVFEDAETIAICAGCGRVYGEHYVLHVKGILPDHACPDQMGGFYRDRAFSPAPTKPASPLVRSARCRYIESSAEERRCVLCAGHIGGHEFAPIEVAHVDEVPAASLLLEVEKARESARVAELDLRAALNAAAGQGAAWMVLYDLIEPAVKQEQRLAQLAQLIGGTEE